MRAVIFQMGLLFFFTTIIVLWLNGVDIMIATLKATVVFVISTAIMAFLAYMFVYFKEGNSNESNRDEQKAETKA